MRSLRWKLILGILCGITLVLAVGGTLVYLTIKERLYEEFDRSLVQRTVLMASMIEPDANSVQIEWLENGTNPPGHRLGTDYFSVWTKGHDETLAASLDLEAGSLPRFGGSFEHPEVRAVTLPDGRPARCAGIEFEVRQGLRGEDDADEASSVPSTSTTGQGPTEAVVQLVIAKVDTVAPTLAAIQRPLFALWAGCTGFGAVVIWMVVRRGLRPLDQLRAQIGNLEEGATGQRIHLPRQPAELEPVTQELNRLLERVAQALVRERTLTSNVAHELRTPIAGLLSNLEVTLTRLRPPAEYRESAEECFEIAKRMNWLVNNLLSITRIEAGNIQLQQREVLIGQVLSEWWRPFEARATGRRLQVDWQVHPDARIETDPEFFRVVVNNLFDNAVSYAPEGGTIRIEASAGGAVSVANPASGLNAEGLRHAFDPFWRNPLSREGETAHAGLGLNLCKKIIELLGGRISARIQEPERMFVVQLDMA
jgi:signal transduction histidine kinase